MPNRSFCMGILLPLSMILCFSSSLEADPTTNQVRAAMDRATDFMMNTVALRGGFVWKYALDLKERYGELKARDSMIWVQGGTVSVGLMLVDAYKATGDRKYLEYAGRSADALIWGQLPCGGWHYFIDFDPPGVQPYYDSFFSRCWGWQEYLHYYGNATFDDDVTAHATQFLLRLYNTTLDPKYRRPLLKALDFILEAQYPCGAWPQRFPKTKEFPHHGLPDYTSCYTFNDEVISSNIELLLEAARTLGDDTYDRAARRGMDFYIISQLPRPQAGWAQQYGFDMKPAWGRTFEINTVSAWQTVENIHDLFRFYKATGDRRYLEPIPKALDWLDSASKANKLDEPYTHTCFYELGTNKAIYARRKTPNPQDIRFEVSYDSEGVYPYALRYSFDIEAMRKECERLARLSPDQVRGEYEKSLQGEPMPVGAEQAERLIGLLDERGGWVVENIVLNTDDFENNPPYVFQGYNTKVYVKRMYKLINYLRSMNQ